MKRYALLATLVLASTVTAKADLILDKHYWIGPPIGTNQLPPTPRPTSVHALRVVILDRQRSPLIWPNLDPTPSQTVPAAECICQRHPEWVRQASVRCPICGRFLWSFGDLFPFDP